MSYTKAFEECWSLYPARNGKKAGKKQAFEQWKKLTNGDHRVIKTDLKNRLKDSAWRAGEYVPDMLRYLRHRRWEDETSEVEYEPRPNTYTPPIAKVSKIDSISNRIFVHVLTSVGGVDTDTLRNLYRAMKKFTKGKEPTKEFVQDLKTELMTIAREFDGDERQREIEDAKAAFRVRQGVTT